MEDWREHLATALDSEAGSRLTDNSKRFGSFAPERSGAANWFVDGEDYMAAVADGISAAKEEVFITDWWLSPEVYLKRDPCKSQWRLDCLLQVII